MKERGVPVGAASLWRFFGRRRITLKKTAHAAEQQRPDVAEEHWNWFEAQPDLDPERLVFIDETGATTKMAGYGGDQTRRSLPRRNSPWPLENRPSRGRCGYQE